MSATPKALAVAVKNRERYYQRVQLTYDLINKTAQQSEFLQRCKVLDDTFERFEVATEQINTLNLQIEDPQCHVDTIQCMKSFEEIFFRVKAHEAQLHEARAEASVASVSSPDVTQRLKLPTISVPVFDGNITEFPSWKSLFDEIVHWANISDIQKFSYLKTYVKGSALSAIDAIAFTSANYALAYKTINDRFSKKRTLASHLMNKLLDFQPIAKDTAGALRNFLDHFYVVVESLKSLAINNVEEFMLLHLGLRVLDSRTTMEFENEYKDSDFPTFGNLVTMVTNKVNILELNAESCSSTVVPVKRNFHPKMLVTNVTHDVRQTSSEKSKSDLQKRDSSTCSVCSKGYHRIGFCAKFKSMDPHQRYTVIKNLKLCFGCFSSSHTRRECTSKYSCRSCGSSAHHSLLHPTEQTKPSSTRNTFPSTKQPLLVDDEPARASLQSQVSLECRGTSNNDSVLLGTATVQVQDVMGQWIPVRCVIDPGSQISAITEHLAQLIKLPRQQCNMEVSGIGSLNTLKARGEIECNVLPHSQIARASSCEPFQVKAIVLQKIATDLSGQVPAQVLRNFSHLQLADLSYHNNQLSSSIDMLIGAEYYAHLIISTHPILQGSPSAIPSKLGWLLIGRINDRRPDIQSGKCTSLFISSEDDQIATQLQRFWEVEEVCAGPQIENPEDIQCEKHFQETCSRDETGRYVVRLPFRNNQPPELGTNEVIAQQRLKNLARKLEKNPHMKTLYRENLQNYLDEGHMIVAREPSSYFLVHHAVCKESSSTTKLRVVYDAGVKGSKNVSLAESLLVGPKLQSDIGDLLVSFRLNAVALTGDIQAMYRSICIAEPDRRFQHILWFDEHFDKPIEYELTRVTFGLPSSPYAAQRVLRQLVSDEGHRYPLASSVVENDIYVDDIVTGGKDISEVVKLRDQLISMLDAGGFKLRKWASSHPDVIKDLPQEACEMSHDFGSDESVKLLGVRWCPADDVFFFTVCPSTVDGEEILTKRRVLSIVASLYDLNGYLSPVTVWMKIFLQRLWLEKSISWDSPLSPELQEQWRTFSSQLSILQDIRLPRFILSDKCTSLDLVGLADASSAAYGAVVYLRVCDVYGKVTTHLLRAKTKVAPLKVHTINRLELCAALLLVKVLKSLDFLHKRITINNVYLFSDSYTVLSWLKTQPFRLKIYVANRVSQILEYTQPNQWRHVSSDKNSADPASRGLMPSQLINNNLWFKGPSFLRSPPDTWPQPIDRVEDCLPDLKPIGKALLVESGVPYLIQVMSNFSSLTKLQRVFAYILRFIRNVKHPTKRVTGCLSLMELRHTLLTCVRLTQNFYLGEDIRKVKTGRECSSNLRFLSPIINSAGLFAVGGRLALSPLADSAKHPILLPKKSHLASLIIWDCHYATCHGGPKIVQSLLQQKWWILGARGLIRQLLFTCVACFKLKPKFRQPLMADLPMSRYAQGRPFLNVGIDFAGPFSYKTGPRRNSPVDKCYFAIFVCMSTKCLHLELVSSLSSVAFLACLDRFVGRRGLPTYIFSDNGTNFQGASSYLKEVQHFLKNSEQEITRHLNKNEIQWSNITPSAPNMGGLWEAGVKAVKHHLRHILQGQNWNFEELSTFLIRVEAILNSRPLCSVSSNPNDGVDYLSPGHFLIGAPLIARPEYDLSEQPLSHLQRWKLITSVTQSFWKRWSKDFLHTMIQRSKWIKKCEEIQVNDVVLVQGQNLPSQKWPLGIVVRVLPGADGITRVVEVKTARGLLLRPVSKVAVLPLASSDV